MTEDKKERARTEEGKFKGDNPDTPEVNEAYKPVKYYLMRDGLANTVLQKLASLPYADVSDMMTAFRAMQHVMVDPTTKKVLGTEEEVAGQTKK